jgi:Leucine-rich repeat (LRR) protein
MKTTKTMLFTLLLTLANMIFGQPDPSPQENNPVDIGAGPGSDFSTSRTVNTNGGAVPLDLPVPSDADGESVPLFIRVIGVPESSNGEIQLPDGSVVAVGSIINPSDFADLRIHPQATAAGNSRFRYTVTDGLNEVWGLMDFRVSMTDLDGNGDIISFAYSGSSSGITYMGNMPHDDEVILRIRNSNSVANEWTVVNDAGLPAYTLSFPANTVTFLNVGGMPGQVVYSFATGGPGGTATVNDANKKYLEDVSGQIEFAFFTGNNSPISHLSAAAENGNIKLTWDNADPLASTFLVRYGDDPASLSNVVTVNTTEFSLVNPPSGLQHYFTVETADGGNTGQPSALVSTTVFANRGGNALSLDGSGDYVRLPDESLFDFSDDAFTVEVWFRSDNFSQDWQAIVNKGDNTWRLQRTENTDYLTFDTNHDGFSDHILCGHIPVNDNQWHHAAAVFDGTYKYLYVDGVLDCKRSVPNAIETDDNDVTIGHNVDKPTRDFKGEIDEVRIWNRALSIEEIGTRMMAPLVVESRDLLALYRFDATNVSSAYDNSGLAQHAEFVGAAALVESAAFVPVKPADFTVIPVNPSTVEVRLPRSAQGNLSRAHFEWRQVGDVAANSAGSQGIIAFGPGDPVTQVFSGLPQNGAREYRVYYENTDGEFGQPAAWRYVKPVQQQGQAMRFDGSTNHIAIPATYRNSFNGSDSLVISVWLQPQAGANEQFVLGQIPANGSAMGLSLYLDNTLIPRCELIANASTDLHSADRGLDAGSWNHLLLLRRQDDLYFYINGRQAGQKTIAGDIISSSRARLAEWKIGAMAGYDNYQGLMDELILAKAEINDNDVLMAASTRIPGYFENIIAAYHFDQIDGDVVLYDESRMDQNGAINGSASFVESQALVPFAPDVTGVQFNAGEMRINWQASVSTDVATYKLYRSTDPTLTAPADTNLLADNIAKETVLYRDNTVSVNRFYRYWLSAVDASGYEGQIAAGRSAANVLIVNSSADDGAGTLREALAVAIASSEARKIAFAAGMDWLANPIRLQANLPVLSSDSITLLGDPDNTGIPKVMLVDATGGGLDYGLKITGANNTVQGLVIGNFNKVNGTGVFIEGVQALENRVIGCYLGTNSDATGPNANHYGVFIDAGASGNHIGGVEAYERNVISGNNDAGILIKGAATRDNHIINNIIGLNAAGTTSITPSGKGIHLYQCKANFVGNGRPDGRNIISGHNGAGLRISGSANASSGHVISGNYIGLTLDGTQAKSNNPGIQLAKYAQNNTIGSRATAAEPNVIAGNLGSGIHGSDTERSGNLLMHNRLGLAAATDDALGNGNSDIFLADHSRKDSIISNIIASSASWGVRLQGANTDSIYIWQNAIYGHNLGGIVLENDAQDNVTAPWALSLAADSTLSGLAAGEASIQVFADNFGEGQRFVASTTADGSGNWSLKIDLDELINYTNLTATQDSAGHSSPFSAPLAAGTNGPLLITSNADIGLGSLRAAIEHANANPGADTIRFDPGFDWANNPILITDSQLPGLSDDSTCIDGDVDNDGGPDILLDGGGVIGRGLQISSANAITVMGLALINFTSTAIDVFRSDHVTIVSNHIGLALNGESAGENNGDHGIHGSFSDYMQIGDGTLAGRNVIAGHAKEGVDLYDGKHISILGNIVGLNRAGDRAIPNGWHGISLDGSFEHIEVGNGTLEGRNIISGNGQLGLYVDGPKYAYFKGNYIGTDISGSAAIENGDGAIFWRDAFNVTFGDTTELGRNVCAGGYGAPFDALIYFHSSDSIAIKGNYIGVGANGVDALGTRLGMYIAHDNKNVFVGGASPQARNVIANATEGGILITRADTIAVVGNYLGVDAAGTTAAPITGHAIWINENSNVIDIAQNVVANSSEYGIYIEGSEVDSVRATANAIYAHGNGAIFVDTGSLDGITPPGNLVLQPDSTLVGQAAANARIQVYEDAAGQGENYLGNIFADAGGAWQFKIDFSTLQGLGFVTATQDSAGNTSAFSLPVQIIYSPRQADSLALLQIYNDMEGDSWNRRTNWLSAQPIDSWYGVGVTDGRVDSLNLSFNNVGGQFSAAIFELEELHHLDLWANHDITDSIPDGISRLQSLRYFAIGGNDMSGNLTSSLGQMQNLETLLITNWNVGTEIPLFLGNLKNLTHLQLRGIDLVGTIPDTLYGLGNLLHLDLGENDLVGFSDGISRLSQLEVFDFYNNNASFTIPVGLYELNKLKVLRLKSNRITNPLSEKIGQLDSLQILDIHLCRIPGEIPAALTQLSELREIHAYWNEFTGTIPENIGDLQKLEYLDLSNNDLEAPLPASLWTLVKLTYLDIGSMRNLGGGEALPEEVGDLEALVELDVNGSDFAGPLPAAIGNLSELETLNIQNNSFTAFPAEFGQLKKLKFLFITNNPFNGPIPSSFNELDILYTLSAENCGFTGEFPDGFDKVDPRNLYLEGNELDQLNLNFAGFTRLQLLDVVDNKLDFSELGKVPQLSLSFAFDPQKPFADTLYVDLEEGESYTQTFSLGGAGNIYAWYKDNGIDTSIVAADSVLNLQALDGSVAGVYFATARNENYPLLGDLILTRNPVIVTFQGGEIPVSPADSSALIALKAAMNPESWGENNWAAGIAIANWDGVTIRDGRVVGLDLNNAGISNDSLAAVIGDLTALEVLVLAGNDIGGELPESLGALKNLQDLNLATNRFSGVIPDTLGGLTELRSLHLKENSFSGALPASFARLVNLQELFLNDNLLTSLAIDWSGMSQLQSLTLGANQLQFDDLQAINLPAIPANFVYSPQAIVGTDTLILGVIGRSLSFTFVTGGSANTYLWQDSDGNTLATSSTLSINPFTAADSGRYFATVNNPSFPDLTLARAPLAIRVNQAPVLTKTFADLTLAAGVSEQFIAFLPEYFTDPDDGLANFSVTPPQHMLVRISGDSLYLSTAADFNGRDSLYLFAADRAGQLTRTTIYARIIKDNNAPEITGIANTSVEINTPFALDVLASDADGDPLAYTLRPAWLPIDNQGRIRFTPTAAQRGIYSVDAIVSDGIDSAKTTFTLTIFGDAEAPIAFLQFTSGDSTKTAGLGIFVAANDTLGGMLGSKPEELRYSYQLQSSSNDLAFEQSGVDLPFVQFYPLPPGRYDLTVHVIDAKNNGADTPVYQGRHLVILRRDELPGNRWQMITQSRVFTASMFAFLRNEAEAYIWRNDEYIEANQVVLSPGYALWYLSSLDKTLDISAAGFRLDDSVRVELLPGWNQLGNPYDLNAIPEQISCTTEGRSMPLAAAVDNDLILGSAYIYLNTDTLTDTDIYLEESLVSRLYEPWQGFWLYLNASSGSLLWQREPNDFRPGIKPESRQQPANAKPEFSLCLEGDPAKSVTLLFGHGFDVPCLPQPGPESSNVLRLENGKMRLRETPLGFDETRHYPLDFYARPGDVITVDNRYTANAAAYIYFDESGEYFPLENGEVVLDAAVGGASRLIISNDASFDPELIPVQVELGQNYPNPFNGTTTFTVSVPFRSDNQEAIIEIYNTLGQCIHKLFNGRLSAGVHQFFWNGKNTAGATVASGVYFYRLRLAGSISTRKAILLK